MSLSTDEDSRMFKMYIRFHDIKPLQLRVNLAYHTNSVYTATLCALDYYRTNCMESPKSSKSLRQTRHMAFQVGGIDFCDLQLYRVDLDVYQYKKPFRPRIKLQMIYLKLSSSSSSSSNDGSTNTLYIVVVVDKQGPAPLTHVTIPSPRQETVCVMGIFHIPHCFGILFFTRRFTRKFSRRPYRPHCPHRPHRPHRPIIGILMGKFPSRPPFVIPHHYPHHSTHHPPCHPHLLCHLFILILSHPHPQRQHIIGKEIDKKISQ